MLLLRLGEVIPVTKTRARNRVLSTMLFNGSFIGLLARLFGNGTYGTIGRGHPYRVKGLACASGLIGFQASYHARRGNYIATLGILFCVVTRWGVIGQDFTFGVRGSQLYYFRCFFFTFVRRRVRTMVGTSSYATRMTCDLFTIWSIGHCRGELSATSMVFLTACKLFVI